MIQLRQQTMKIRTNEHDSVEKRETVDQQSDLNGRIRERSWTLTAVTRAYRKSLRAAEMATGEMTGGDYVLARFATRGSRVALTKSSNKGLIARRRVSELFDHSNCRF